jgi:hypothetical protein
MISPTSLSLNCKISTHNPRAIAIAIAAPIAAPIVAPIEAFQLLQ